MSERPTIYDVARVTGLATSTVSRAFTQPGRVNPQTVQRIIAAADEMGYVPNPTARGLSTGRTGSLAMVVPNIGNPFFTQFMRAFHTAAHARQHSTYLIDTGENPEEEARRLAVVSSQVDGVALISPRMQMADLIELTAGRRVVVANRQVEGVPSVWIDSAPALRDALDDLVRLGHRSVVYARGPRGGYSDSIRRRTARSAARSRGVLLTMTSAFRDDQELAEAALEAVAATGATAVLAHSDAAAVALLTACRQRGIRVPADVTIVGHDDIEWASIVHPALSTVSAPTDAMGRLSADLLIDAVLGVGTAEGETPHRSLLAHYVARESTGPAVSRP